MSARTEVVGLGIRYAVGAALAVAAVELVQAGIGTAVPLAGALGRGGRQLAVGLDTLKAALARQRRRGGAAGGAEGSARVGIAVWASTFGLGLAALERLGLRRALPRTSSWASACSGSWRWGCPGAVAVGAALAARRALGEDEAVPRAAFGHACRGGCAGGARRAWRRRQPRRGSLHQRSPPRSTWRCW
ncbi:MAG: hypothetical protein R3F59_02745 [Myxococcota bacterium]